MIMPNPPLFDFSNPFVPNPAFNQPQDNFIQKGIENGIEKGFSNIGDKILHAGQIKAQSFAQSLPEFATIALVCFYVYLGYKTFIKREPQGLDKLFPVTMIYTIFRLFWKVVLHI